MGINYSVKGRTKSGVEYSIAERLVSFSSLGINSLHQPSEINIITFADIQEPLKSHWLAQTGTTTNGVTVALTESEAHLFAESLNVEIRKI